jgi:enterochelin esterase-like enzyme
MPERLDRLIGHGEMAPCVVAFPDCFTRLGGNQYINSIAMGRWDDFLRLEAVPEIERRFHCGGEGRRGVFGKSSGGYGALVHAMLHSDFWSASASHSGDVGFELLFAPDFPVVLRALAKVGNSVRNWFEKFEAAPKAGDSDVHILMDLAMAASYDPDPDAFLGIRLPVTFDTCEHIPERWANWMKWDPLTLVERHGESLKRLKALYIDCGDIDQYNLVYGSRRLHKRLTAMGVAHTYEEFPDNHSSVDYRMDVSLPLMARALAG